MTEILLLEIYINIVINRHVLLTDFYLATTFISYISILANFILHVAIAFDNFSYRNEMK